jgi:3-hydroxyisobutyrate dehydrogenase-like beta-hydroxyacid dehydrogenase
MTTTKEKNTLIGLGAMGRSVLKCLISKGGLEVHAWNRGVANRKAVMDVELEHVTVYENVTDAIAASDNLVFVIISSGAPNLNVVHDLVHQSNNLLHLEGKTLVNFVNHEPFAPLKLDKVLEAANVHHIAGSMFATPEIICTPGALVLTSAPK